MTILLILIGVIVIVATLYLLYRQYINHLKSIDSFVKSQAQEKGLEIRALTYPTFSEWKDEPFDKEIKIGTLGFYGFPTNEQYLRVIDCIDKTSKTKKTFWIRVTNNRKTRTLTSEWMETTNAR